MLISETVKSVLATYSFNCSLNLYLGGLDLMSRNMNVVRLRNKLVSFDADQLHDDLMEQYCGLTSKMKRNISHYLIEVNSMGINLSEPLSVCLHLSLCRGLVSALKGSCYCFVITVLGI